MTLGSSWGATGPDRNLQEPCRSATIPLADDARRDLTGLEAGIVGPDDPGYDEARAVHNGMIDRRPALIVRCSSADDVARTIAFARAHDAPIAVRGGGHN